MHVQTYMKENINTRKFTSSSLLINREVSNERLTKRDSKNLPSSKTKTSQSINGHIRAKMSPDDVAIVNRSKTQRGSMVIRNGSTKHRRAHGTRHRRDPQVSRNHAKATNTSICRYTQRISSMAVKGAATYAYVQSQQHQQHVYAYVQSHRKSIYVYMYGYVCRIRGKAVRNTTI